jgi:uncharacterized protein HemX
MNIKDYVTQLIVASGIVGIIAGYFFGGKQKNAIEEKQVDNNKIDPISRGADTSVGTMERILKLQEDLMRKANETADKEREHRETCEQQVDELRKRVIELEKLHKNNESH